MQMKRRAQSMAQPFLVRFGRMRFGVCRSRGFRHGAFWHGAFRHSHISLDNDRGSVTAEYVIATLAAVSFAGLLVVILRGDEVRQILTDMVRSALSFAG